MLPEWSASPTYVATRVWTPSEPWAAVYDTVQEPSTRVQLVGLKPVPPVHVTVPLGRNGFPGEVSETLAVHVTVVLTGPDDEEHPTDVVVVRVVAVTVRLPLLAPWSVSPE